MTEVAPVVRRTPVMADVARLAGVSHQTVSRVINGQNNLRPATREKVEDAIRQLGYRPNSAARALVTRKSATFGVIGSKSGYWGPSTVHRTIQAAGRDAGYFVSSVNLQSHTREELVDAIDHLRNQSVEGIVLISATDDAVAVAQAQEQFGVPVVVVEGDASKTRWTVGVDQVAGAELGTRHLIELGHTDIVHLAGPPEWTEARAPPARLAARDVRRRAAARRSTSPATGRPPAASRRVERSRPARTSRPSSAPTTRWPSACCARCQRGRPHRADRSARGERRGLRRHPRGAPT